MEEKSPIVVVKVGGSLLSLPDLSERWDAIQVEYPRERLLMVCGGGEAADVVRRWQPLHGLTDEQAHWLALRAMSLTEQLLSQLLPNAVIVRSHREIQAAWNAGQLAILAAESFIRCEEMTGNSSLPHTWAATSDSIAAWVLRLLNGERLVLLKSCDLPDELTLEAAAARGLVDSWFPVGGEGLAISWVNLRAERPSAVNWTSSSIPRT